MVSFVDEVILHLRAGDGGNGCVSIKREKFRPMAGPDGADGGNGGSISLIADPNVTTLLDYHFRPHRAATSGNAGAGDFRNGARGEDMELAVPVGTVVKKPNGEQIADLDEPGIKLLVAEGGQGGLGNAALSSVKRKAPGFALLGVPGWSGDIVLELKTVADVALVGYPSAGKSSLIAAMSAARPKIADYPFTTLHPNLGVVEAGSTRYTVADVPGLIEGASEGKGLGLQFLRHVERCSALLHVIDCATLDPGRDPESDLEKLLVELDNYQVDEGAIPLTKRPQLIALNKIDLPDGKELAEFVKESFEARGYQVFLISTITKEGLRELNFALAAVVNEDRQSRQVAIRPRITLMQQSRDESSFDVKSESRNAEPLFRIVGAKPERWVAQTDFGNEEAIGYLAERLAKIGIEEALLRAGAKRGSTVVIGPENGIVFDWEPMVTSVAEVSGPRGSDSRLDPNNRRTNQQRRIEYHETMDVRTRMRQRMQETRESSLVAEEFLTDNEENQEK